MGLYFTHVYIKWHLEGSHILCLLAPLVFEAALFINWREFRKDLP